MCDMNCFNCQKPDCDYGEVTSEERKAQDEIDRKIMGSRKSGRQLAEWKYRHSEKGREAERRKTQKKIASGKNAEYCRAYYQRKKLKKMEVAQNVLS